MMLFAVVCFGRVSRPDPLRSDAACHFPVTFEKRVVALEVRIFRTRSLKLLMELVNECLQQSYRRSRCILVSDRPPRRRRWRDNNEEVFACYSWSCCPWHECPRLGGRFGRSSLPQGAATGGGRPLRLERLLRRRQWRLGIEPQVLGSRNNARRRSDFSVPG